MIDRENAESLAVLVAACLVLAAVIVWIGIHLHLL